MKKLLLVLLLVILAAGVGLFLWARAVLGGDAVRAAVESQLARALGQPVTVGAASATILPRVTLTLHDVAIGQPARILVSQLHVGTDLRALVSRRIEHASVELSGARIDLPLPPFAFASRAPSAGDSSSRPPVELVSIDTVTMTGVQVVSGGRTLSVDADLAPAGTGVHVREIRITADGTSVVMAGDIADLAGPTGELAVTAGGVNVLDLLAFIADFSSGAGLDAAPRGGPDATPMDLRVKVDAGRATVGTLVLDSLAASARITPAALTLEPATFGVFGGRYSGTLAWSLGEPAGFTLKASLSGVDVAQAMAYAGSGGAVTGRLAGRIDVAGSGTTRDRVVGSARGTARLEVTDGTVAGLGLVRAVVLATSGRADAPGAPPLGEARAPEPFSRLGATFAIGGGVARTSDLRFESPDVLMAAAGAIVLASQEVNLKGRVQLSEALSRQAGRDLVRYASEGGRVTLPVTVSGAAGNFHVKPELAEAARRAILKQAEEEAKKLLKRIIK